MKISVVTVCLNSERTIALTIESFLKQSHADKEMLVIDGMSLLYLMKAEIDFVENLGGAYFQVNNPNAASSCGCGNSFAIG